MTVVLDGAGSLVTVIVVMEVGQLVGVQSVIVSVTVMKVMVSSAVTVTVLSGGVLVVITGHPVILIILVVQPHGGHMTREHGRVMGRTVITVVIETVPVGLTVIVSQP